MSSPSKISLIYKLIMILHIPCVLIGPYTQLIIFSQKFLMVFSSFNLCYTQIQKFVQTVLSFLNAIKYCSFKQWLIVRENNCYSCDPSAHNATSVSKNNGIVCDDKWLEQRDCSQYTTCTECLAKWPTNINESQVSTFIPYIFRIEIITFKSF